MSTFLPDIADLISDYLDQFDLTFCVRVCKSWNTLFIPQLYRMIRVELPQENPAMITAFHRYGHFLRTLKSFDRDFPDPTIFGPACRFLTTIYIKRDCDYLSTTWTQRMMALIDNNPHIHTFTICDKPWNSDLDYLISDLNFFRHLPALKDLSLNSVTIKTKSSWDEILECGQRLDRLDCDRLKLESIKDTIHLNTSIESGSQEQQVMWKLTKLCYVGDLSFGMLLLERCPHLTYFSGKEPQYIGALIKHYHSGYLLQMQHLYLNGSPVDAKDSEEFIRICGKSSGLKSFDVPISNPINNVLSALATCHAETLERVCLQCHGSSTTINALHELLGNCLRLKNLVLSRQRISMEELVQSPWVCKDLEVLMLHVEGEWDPNRHVDSDGGEPLYKNTHDKTQPSASVEGHKSMKEVIELRRRLWDQIGAMTHLKKLHVHEHRIKSCSENCQHIRKGDDQMCNLNTLVMMDEGLKYILRLRQLVEFKIDRRAFRMSYSEMAILRMRRPGLKTNFIW